MQTNNYLNYRTEVPRQETDDSKDGIYADTWNGINSIPSIVLISGAMFILGALCSMYSTASRRHPHRRINHIHFPPRDEMLKILTDPDVCAIRR